MPPGTARLRLVLRQDLPAGSLSRLLAALGPPPAELAHPGAGPPPAAAPPAAMLPTHPIAPPHGRP